MSRQVVTLLIQIELVLPYIQLIIRLLQILEKNFGIIGETKGRSASYLSSRKQRIWIEKYVV